MTVCGFIGEKSRIQAIGMLLIDLTRRAPTAICSDDLARRTPPQRGPRSGHASQTNVWGLQMRVCRVDQDAASLNDTFQRFRHVHPMCNENNDVALDRLLAGPRDGAWTKISDKMSQCLRTS
jgi:hypothetical protein